MRSTWTKDPNLISKHRPMTQLRLRKIDDYTCVRTRDGGSMAVGKGSKPITVPVMKFIAIYGGEMIEDVDKR